MSIFIVVYMSEDNDLYASEVFDDRDSALAFVSSDEGAGDQKAYIIKAECECNVYAVHLTAEPHT